MAKKRHLLWLGNFSIIGIYEYLIGYRMTKRLLVFMIALLCILISPVVAKVPATNSTVLNRTNSQSQTQDVLLEGKKLYEAQRFAEAAKVLQQAAAVFKANGDNLRAAMTLSNLSLAQQQLGLWTEAESAIAESRKLLQNLQTSPEHSAILAQALDVQGRLEFSRGQEEAALTTWQQAGKIYQQIGDSTGLIRNRINSAQALQASGSYRQANKILSEVEQTLQNQPDSLLKATGLRKLGNILQVVGDLKQSQRLLEQSLVLAKRFSSPQATSEALFSLGNAARIQQDTQAALDYYKQAQAASGDRNLRIQSQLNQLSLLIQTKQFAEALALTSQTESEIEKLPPSRMAVNAKINFAQSLSKLAKAEDGTGIAKTNVQLQSAQVLAKAIQEAQSLEDKRAQSYALGTLGELYEQTQQLVEAKNLSQQALLIAQSANASDIAYQWQWQIGRLLKQQGNINDAFVGDVGAAIAHYEAAFKTLQSLRSDLVASNADIQFSFRESVEPVYRELVELLLQPQNNSQPSSQNLQKARDVIESLQLAELDNFFRSACINANQQVVDQLVDQKDQTAAVIYPIILPNHLDVILKLPNKNLLHHKVAISQDKLETTLADLRGYLSDVTQTAQVRQLSQQIYNWIIEPFADPLANSGIKTLVFILDGELRNVPMGVLYDQKQQKYLVQKYAIALAPGLQLLDPKPLQQVQLNTLTAAVTETRTLENRNFPPLQNVVRELESIQAEVPKSGKLLNQQFTETSLQKELQSLPFSVIHLATHGEFSSDPEKTFILTWDKLLKVKEFDNLLRLSDQRRSNTIELLILSACKTAQGDKRAALGLAGVAVRAGARSTIATLWSVDDETTADFMSQLYRDLKAGVNKAEALQRAQLAIFAKEKRPYFWAPYVLLGNWL
jgi:CHAT domain-containing protein